MPRHDSLSALRKDIHDHLLDPSVDTKVKQWARRRLAAIREDYERVTRPGAYHDFVLEYIQREATKYKAHLRNSPQDHPYDGTRERAICGCDETCALKREELPKEVADHGVDRGTKEFRHAHSGHPIVLDEARRKFGSLVGDVEDALTVVMVGLADEVVIASDGRRVPVADLPPTWTPGEGVPGGEDTSDGDDAEAVTP